MNILYKSFHLVDVDNERTVRNDISEDFDSFINDFVDFSNHNEKAKAYVIMHEEDLISDCIQRIVNDTDIEYRNELSDKIALKLLESEKLAQAKIYPTGSKVKRGSLVQALVQNSDDEYEYILAKVEHVCIEIVVFLRKKRVSGNLLFIRCIQSMIMLFLMMFLFIQIQRQNIGPYLF